MNEITTFKFSQFTIRLRWPFVWLAVLIIALHQIIEHVWLASLPDPAHFATQLLFYSLAISILIWWGLTILRQSMTQAEKSEENFLQAQTNFQEAHKQLTTLSHSNGRLAAAHDEESLVKVLLELPLNIVPALGSSLICFDQNQHPLPPLFFGELPPSAFETWSTHLSDKQVRQQCAGCTSHMATSTAPCPLFLFTNELLGVQKIHCLELKCNGRLYAVLNIYLTNSHSPTPDERNLLDAMAREMALALESYCLRRDLAILYQLEQMHQDTSPHANLHQILIDTVNAFEVTGGVLYLADEEKAEIQVQAQAGQSLGADLDLVTCKVSKVWQTDTPLILYNFKQKNSTGIRSILAAPMQSHGHALGILVLWSTYSGTFTDYHVRTVAIIANQTAQLIQNNQVYTKREYQAMIAERGRLAREIHDGLAQTFGYLKLRSAQITDWLQHGEIERPLDALVDVKQLLDCAYTDAREAIDGLRLKAVDHDVQIWVDEIISKFEAVTGIPVDTTSFPGIYLPLEVQAQLQRIIQETFSNVRKHADATRVWLEWHVHQEQLLLNIRDNGCGFDPNDIPPSAQHGLSIMEERACLLGGLLQITSCSDEGTTVTLTMPYSENIMVEKNETTH